MTGLLQQAFDEAYVLFDQEQDQFAAWLMVELRSDREWDRRFAESQPQLDQLAEESLHPHRSQ